MSKQVLKQYYEESDSSDNRYTVTEYDDDSWACSCKRWTTRVPREDCKHIKRRKEKVSRAEKWQPESERWQPEPAMVSYIPPTPAAKPKPVPEPRGVLEVEHVRKARPGGF